MTHDGKTYYFEVSKKTRKEFRAALEEGLGDNHHILTLKFVDLDDNQCSMEKRCFVAGNAIAQVWNITADIVAEYRFVYCFGSKSRGDKYYEFAARMYLCE